MSLFRRSKVKFLRKIISWRMIVFINELYNVIFNGVNTSIAFNFLAFIASTINTPPSHFVFVCSMEVIEEISLIHHAIFASTTRNIAFHWFNAAIFQEWI